MIVESFNIKYQTAVNALKTFANKYDLTELIYLPVNLIEGVNPPAYTTQSGIFVSRQVIEKDPKSIVTYVMHEIMHHVVHSPKQTYSFNPRIVNVAEDFLINYLLKRYFDLDVKKAPIQGIYSRKHALMGLRLSCETIVKKSGKSGRNLTSCGCNFSANSILHSIANKLKAKFRFVTEDALYYKDIEDQRTFESIREDFAGIQCNLPIDLNSTLFSLFLKLYNREVVPTPNVGKVLTASEAIPNLLEASKVRKYTVGNEEVTSIVILNIFNCISDIQKKAPLYLAHYVQKLRGKEELFKAWTLRLQKKTYSAYVDKYKRRFTKKMVKSELKKLEKDIRTTRASIKKWEHRIKNPLPDLLYNHEIKVKRPKSLYTTNTLNKVQKIVRDKEHEIDVVPNVATRELKLYLRAGMKRALLAIECYTDISDMFKDLTRPEEDDKLPDLKDIDLNDLTDSSPDDEEDENSSGDNQNQGNPSENDGESQDQEAEGNSETDENGTPSKIEGKEGNRSGKSGEGSGNDGNSSKDDSDEALANLAKDKPTDAKGGGGKGQGSGKSVPQLLSELPVRTLKSLSKILKYADMFENRLVESANRKFDDTESIALLPNKGNNLEAIDPSELSLLHDPATEMLFYSRLAQHSLNIVSPRMNKLDAIVVAIDNSGSMAGKCYEVATGFSLALMKKLAVVNREGALLSFSGHVNGRVIIRKNAFSLLEILQVLLAPEYGGTNFEAPTMEAFNLKDAMKWKSLTYLMVTDGGGGWSDDFKAYIRQRKTPKDKTYGICTTRGVHALKEFMDETLMISNTGVITDLLKLGNQIL